MGYALDQAAEHLIHALCEAVVLKRRLAPAPDSREAIICHDLIEDLASGLGRHCGISDQRVEGSEALGRFIWNVLRCSETWHIARVFQKTPGMEAYLMAPYFSSGDLQKAQESP